MKFYIDGTFDEILPTVSLRIGSWTMNSDSAIFTTTGGGYPSYSANIETLTATKFNWLDQARKVRGVMIPKY